MGSIQDWADWFQEAVALGVVAAGGIGGAMAFGRIGHSEAAGALDRHSSQMNRIIK
jgi:hypothetical protein